MGPEPHDKPFYNAPILLSDLEPCNSSGLPFRKNPLPSVFYIYVCPYILLLRFDVSSLLGGDFYFLLS